MADENKGNDSREARPADESFRDLLQRDGIALFDGAMGTMLYQKGVFIHRAFEELNLSEPALVTDVHEQYVAAGAHVVETNTFAANRFRLAPHGFAEKVSEINARGVEIAREAAAGRAWVAGSMGPLGVRIEPFGAVGRDEAREVFAEQARALHEAGVDIFVLETFSHLPEMEEAIRALREVADLPIVAQMTVRSGARTPEGVAAAEAGEKMQAAGADVVGVNCADALAILDSLQQMRPAVQRPLLGQPNAGSPRSVSGRSIYMASTDYLVAWGRRALRSGVRLLGGCCGTTPEHIRGLHGLMSEDTPEVSAQEVAMPRISEPPVEPIPTEDKSSIAGALRDGRFVTGIEMAPPRGWTADALTEVAQELAHGAGFRFLSIPEGPADSARLPPMVLAQRCRDEGVEPLVYYSCRGRRLVRMQSDLLGAYACGVRDVLAVTGDPLDPSADPDAPPDLEIDSIGLTNLVYRLNHGTDVGGNPIGRPTGFHVGVKLDPTAHDLERELSRYRWKVDAGAEFAVTVPIFDPAALQALIDRLGDARLPIIASIWPLASSREAEFFEHELANVPVPEPLVDRMKRAEEQGRAVDEGLAIAKELAATVRPMVEGLLVTAPSGGADVALSVLGAVG